MAMTKTGNVILDAAKYWVNPLAKATGSVARGIGRLARPAYSAATWGLTKGLQGAEAVGKQVAKYPKASAVAALTVPYTAATFSDKAKKNMSHSDPNQHYTRVSTMGFGTNYQGDSSEERKYGKRIIRDRNSFF